MSRCTANPGLARLLEEKRVRTFGDDPMAVYQVIDIALDCGCCVRCIHEYSTVKKALPFIEQKMAAVFGISVANMRRRLFGTKAVFAERKKLFRFRVKANPRRTEDDAPHYGHRTAHSDRRKKPVRQSNVRKVVQ